ncbi:hypothetical protein [Coralliovum pocilloporae]|uniref:hypothetical protein n=1 Tax=Coralliovum pocilloporae TaxID=3066369 RepID=UPI0033071C88
MNIFLEIETLNPEIAEDATRLREIIATMDNIYKQYAIERLSEYTTGSDDDFMDIYTDYLDHSCDLIRIECLQAIARGCFEKAEIPFDAIYKRLTDDEPQVRRYALNCLFEQNRADTFEIVSERLRLRSHIYEIVTAYGLFLQLGKDEFLGKFLKQLENDDFYSVYYACGIISLDETGIYRKYADQVLPACRARIAREKSDLNREALIEELEHAIEAVLSEVDE